MRLPAPLLLAGLAAAGIVLLLGAAYLVTAPSQFGTGMVRLATPWPENVTVFTGGLAPAVLLVATGADDAIDSDGDGVPDPCDACPGNDDGLDADGDSSQDAGEGGLEFVTVNLVDSTGAVVATTTTDLRNPSSPNSFSMKSFSSLPRSPINAITLTSARA